jgi:acetamidase/formamidase
MSTIHTLEPERRTLHGHFSRDLPPVLTIDPGDTVRYRTLDAGWSAEPYSGGLYQGERTKIFKLTPELDSGHAMNGPVFIRGAKPGMTLEVRIDDIRPGAWGGCFAGGWKGAFNEALGIADVHGIIHAWSLNSNTMTGRNHLGHTVTLHPFMGVMGMPPPESGIHSTVPPRVWGGNLDCKELVAGTTLYLPIPVEGALFSVGDGHAAQGDGEISGTAIECPMDRVDLTFDVLDDFPITTPTVKTAEGWLTMGFGEQLNDATVQALESMFALLERLFKLSRLDAVALASIVVDLRITQIANGVLGVHAVLPHGTVR